MARISLAVGAGGTSTNIGCAVRCSGIQLVGSRSLTGPTDEMRYEAPASATEGLKRGLRSWDCVVVSDVKLSRIRKACISPPLSVSFTDLKVKPNIGPCRGCPCNLTYERTSAGEDL